MKPSTPAAQPTVAQLLALLKELHKRANRAQHDPKRILELIQEHQTVFAALVRLQRDLNKCTDLFVQLGIKMDKLEGIQAPPKVLKRTPANLLPAARQLWNEGFPVGIANRLARAGLTTREQVASADLKNVRGIGDACRLEVQRQFDRKKR